MSPLTTIRTVAALREAVAGKRVALVPTMGALHDGHLSLVRLAREHADFVVASLFVNPSQFGPGEDFQAYPRDEARDADMLAAAGCDLLYAPAAEAMYPAGFRTNVSVEGLTEFMEGAVRPGHFQGVATVVAKLLIQSAPAIAVFGEKDFQQLAVIRRLALDLDLPVAILAGPIVREPDGLALSSRNVYLTSAQREIAPGLYETLRGAASEIARGAGIAEGEAQARRALLNLGFDAIDYVEVRAAADLARLGPGPLKTSARLLAAARLGATRLLDNVAL
jgi:pantoate--beta-alanine ligase